jgi:hypothetical protein
VVALLVMVVTMIPILGAWWLTRDGDIGAENGIYGHSRFCNTDFDDKLACLNLSGV